MSRPLAAKACTPCKGGIPPLTPQKAESFHRQVSGWDLRDDAHRIERKFKFRNFGEALRFVSQVGELAEARCELWLGLCDREPADQEDQRSARERLHPCGQADRLSDQVTA